MNIKSFQSLILFTDKVEIGKKEKEPILCTSEVVINMDYFEAAYIQKMNPLSSNKHMQLVQDYLEQKHLRLFTICSKYGKYSDLLCPEEVGKAGTTNLYNYLFS